MRSIAAVYDLALELNSFLLDNVSGACMHCQSTTLHGQLKSSYFRLCLASFNEKQWVLSIFALVNIIQPLKHSQRHLYTPRILHMHLLGLLYVELVL